jgi:histidinol dehydrogenase
VPTQLNLKSADFNTAFTRFLTIRESEEADVRDTVADIISTVRKQGNDALIHYAQKFDSAMLTPKTLRLTSDQISEYAGQCDKKIQEALALAAKRIRAYHEKQLPADSDYTDDTGTRLGWRWNAIDAVGLYVPGGLASYPSSVLMNAIPAKVAGVERIAMVVPTPNGEINPAVMAAAHIAGIDEIYPIGGAQAVAALAYGTGTINPVDKIVGPGNAYVAEAKRQVFGKVGIDMIAGPSEILVVADNQNDPYWIATDLLSQAEHDPIAQSILITDDEAFAGKVEEAIKAHLSTLSRANIAADSWEDYGAIITVDSLDQAPALINRIAPEHLELAVESPDAMLDDIRHAGAIFLGRYTPEAMGDYIAGPSHVLPTSQTARFSSGLSVFDFIKRTSLIGCTAESLSAISHQAADLADAEGLSAHALSIRIRG